MSRRQMISTDDSLELLLDTICNTFGAVIFISILASILAQNSSPESASSEETEAAIQETHTRQRELSELRQRQQKLESQLTQQETIIRRFSSEESVSLALQINQDSQTHTRMSAQKTETAHTIERTERERLQLEQAIRDQLKQLNEVKASQAEAANNLRDLETDRGHTAEVRRVHETTKFGFTFALDNGRFYSVHTSDDPNANEADLMLNRDDCEILESAGVTTIRPLKTAGLAIRGTMSPKKDLKARLAVVGKKFVVRLFVAKDSFGEFLPVKEVMTELGLEYALEIMPGEDVDLVLTDKAQERTFVQ